MKSVEDDPGISTRKASAKSPLKLGFADFWPGFEPDSNFFTDLLRSRYDVQISDQPDVLIYSVFGTTHFRYRCRRVFYTGENIRPELTMCDFALSFDYLDDPRHFRLPLYALYGATRLIHRPFLHDDTLAARPRFCNFVYSNPHGEQRNRLFQKLSQYKPVDSGGRHWNNLGYRVADKEEFLRQYKFTIAFENSEYPGYTTEKLWQPFAVGSLPIYWGNPVVHWDFNPHSFLNYYDYGNDEALIERIIELDRNDDLYLSYVRQPPFHGNEPPACCRRELITDFLARAIDGRYRSVGRTIGFRLRVAKRQLATYMQHSRSYAKASKLFNALGAAFRARS